jgi:hypothetical protein
VLAFIECVAQLPMMIVKTDAEDKNKKLKSKYTAQKEAQ